jgi:magnesium chelatase family protein
VTGTAGHVVGVHARIGNGPASFAVTGLREAVMQQMRDRVRAAILNSGLAWPGRAVTVEVSPPCLPCAGLDLAIATAILIAAGTIPPEPARSCVLAAELGLDGRLRPVRGILPAVTAAAADGAAVAVVAPGDAAEAALVPGLAVVPCPDLRAAVTWLGGGVLPARRQAGDLTATDARVVSRLAASPAALVAVQAAAAGGHHLALDGPRASCLAELAAGVRLLMPPLSGQQSAEVSVIYSAAGLLAGLVTEPPWRSPHHTARIAGMIGGGSGITWPGEASLAHCGVLYLDQAPEFSCQVLSALRPALSGGQVTISRGGLITRFPARFTLITASAPCPCGGGPQCRCTPLEASQYRARAETGLGSRLAIRLQPGPADYRPAGPADLDMWAARVADARDRAGRRLAGSPWRANSEIPGPEVARSWRPATGAFTGVARAADLGQISTRSAIEIARLAWTLADLAGRPRPGTAECAQALAFHLGTPC